MGLAPLQLLGRQLGALADAENFSEHDSLVRRRELVEPKTALAVAVLCDGAERQPALGVGPMHRRSAADIQRPRFSIAPRVHRAVVAADAPCAALVTLQGTPPGAEGAEQRPLLRPIGLGLSGGFIGVGHRRVLANKRVRS